MAWDSGFKSHLSINSITSHSKLQINLNHFGADIKLNTAMGSFH